jgi:flagellar protein FliS
VVDQKNAYLKTQILTARPEQLTLMLLDGAIRFAQRGRQCLDEHNFEGSFEALSRAEQIVMELINSLKPEAAPEICRQQASLYMFVYVRLVEANMGRQPAPLQDALAVLATLRETWLMLMDRLQATAAQGASQPPNAESSPALSIKC